MAGVRNLARETPVNEQNSHFSNQSAYQPPRMKDPVHL